MTDMNMKRFCKVRWIALLLLIVAGTAFLSFKNSDNRSFQLAKNIDIFSSIVKELDLLYVDTIDANKTIREGIDAMLYSLDPYTAYYPEDDQSELEQMLKNTYGGIGSIITWNTKLKRSMIGEPYEGMPAAKAGLKAGDILMAIDGQDLEGKNNQEISEMLRGQAGTSFKLTVQRPGVEKPLEFELVRRAIELPIIPYYTKLENNVGYINLSTFSGKPAREFKQAFLDLKKQGITSLVIDLRNNGGGLLDEAVDIANYFLPRGKTLVTTRGKIEQINMSYKTLREPIDLDIPLAVLVNSSTASASEILAGSLQDLDRAVIVGTRTYGKGLVQTTRSLPYGGQMKITTSKYYIPSGRCVQAIDYKHRNADGSVGRIPDSLTTVFHTAAGREVRDGGGVTPDIQVEQEKLRAGETAQHSVLSGERQPDIRLRHTVLPEARNHCRRPALRADRCRLCRLQGDGTESRLQVRPTDRKDIEKPEGNGRVRRLPERCLRRIRSIGEETPEMPPANSKHWRRNSSITWTTTWIISQRTYAI